MTFKKLLTIRERDDLVYQHNSIKAKCIPACRNVFSVCIIVKHSLPVERANLTLAIIMNPTACIANSQFSYIELLLSRYTVDR